MRIYKGFIYANENSINILNFKTILPNLIKKAKIFFKIN